MIKPTKIDTLISNLKVQGPDVAPPFKTEGKSTFNGGWDPALKPTNGLKLTFLMVPRPVNLHAARYKHGEQFWKGFEGWETEF